MSTDATPRDEIVEMIRANAKVIERSLREVLQRNAEDMVNAGVDPKFLALAQFEAGFALLIKAYGANAAADMLRRTARAIEHADGQLDDDGSPKRAH